MLSARQIVKGPAIVPVPTGAPAIGDGVADLHFDGRWQTGEGPAMAIFERTSSERLATLRLASREQLAAALASAERFSPGDADRAAMAERLERAASRIEGDVAQLVDVMQGETGASPYETVREIHLA